MKTLYAIPYSPWSEKARWALDHHGIDYREVVYTPPFHEVLLKVRMREPRRKVSVPLLWDGARAWTDSWDIARLADEAGGARPLFPADELDAILALDRVCQTGLDAGRVLVIQNALEDDSALAEMVPQPLRRVPAPLTVPVVRRVVRRTQRRWGADVRSHDEAVSTYRSALGELREALGGKQFVLGAFSYADISGAQLLGMVMPVRHARVRMGESTRRRFTVPELAHEFADLVAWRDALYDAHRRVAQSVQV
jgi:glutathione S-transferase